MAKKKGLEECKDGEKMYIKNAKNQIYFVNLAEKMRKIHRGLQDAKRKIDL